MIQQELFPLWSSLILMRTFKEIVPLTSGHGREDYPSILEPTVSKLSDSDTYFSEAMSQILYQSVFASSFLKLPHGCFILSPSPYLLGQRIFRIRDTNNMSDS